MKENSNAKEWFIEKILKNMINKKTYEEFNVKMSIKDINFSKNSKKNPEEQIDYSKI